MTGGSLDSVDVAHAFWGCLEDTEKAALRVCLPETCHVSKSVGVMMLAEVRDKPEKPLIKSFLSACSGVGLQTRRKVIVDFGVSVPPSVWSTSLLIHSG